MAAEDTERCIDASAGLAALAADVTRAFRYLGDDPPDWVPARPNIDHDVVVVGG